MKDTQNNIDDMLTLKYFYWEKPGYYEARKVAAQLNHKDRHTARQHFQRSTQGIVGSDGQKVHCAGCADRLTKDPQLPLTYAGSGPLATSGFFEPPPQSPFREQLFFPPSLSFFAHVL